MRDKFRERRARRRVRKVKPGDGSLLQPYRWWQLLQRSLFTIELENASGKSHTYAVDLNYFDWDDRAHLYTDGVQTAVSKLPAAFPVPGGHIEVVTTLYGLRRMHLVPGNGSQQVLTPDPHSAEGLRATLERRRPLLGKTIGAVAIVVLLGSLVLGIPMLLELVTQWDVVADQVGTFTSPFDLPSWANTTVLVAAIIAAVDRALMLRYHWLIDLDTTWLGD